MCPTSHGFVMLCKQALTYPESESVVGGRRVRRHEAVSVCGLHDVLEQLSHHLLPGLADCHLRVVQLVQQQQVLGLDLVELGLPVRGLAEKLKKKKNQSKRPIYAIERWIIIWKTSWVVILS